MLTFLFLSVRPNVTIYENKLMTILGVRLGAFNIFKDAEIVIWVKVEHVDSANVRTTKHFTVDNYKVKSMLTY